METPNTIEGQLTEKVMQRVRGKWPGMPTPLYNGIWSAVLRTLEEELPPLLRGAEQTRREFLKGQGGN